MAQTTPPATTETTTVVYETDVHDFGTLKVGDNGTCEFKFTNTGKVPLIITGAKGSCGCTVPDWPKEPILPGQSNVIKATYDTKRVGAFTKTVTVTSNDKEVNKILTIKGVVEGENPNANMPFKKVSEGTPTER